MLIGRKKEISLFKSILNSGSAEFVAVYGRRRVGKTYLVEQCLSNHGYFMECTGIKNGRLKDQLENFTQQFSKIFYSGIPIQVQKTWKETFAILTEEVKKIPPSENFILFLDEIPWLAGRKSRFLQSLDYFWNTSWSKIPNFKLIVCGSAASWVLNNLINAKGGLYNRITKTILLRPFTLIETKEFLEYKKINLNEKQILDLYMVIGGIPFYLNQLEKSKSIAQNINELCFTKEGLLYSEFPRLFKSLFDAAEIHMKIVKVIGKQHYGISLKELAKKIKIKVGGRLTKRLEELEACGFIQKYIPWGKQKRDAYYKISDEYSLFYLKWIESIAEGSVTPAGPNYWSLLMKTPTWLSWAGYAFENVCYKHVDAIIQALGLQGIGCLIGHWQYLTNDKQKRGALIDLLIDRMDNAINVCEIKYSSLPYIIDKDYAKILINKLEILENTYRNKEFFLTFMTSQGLVQNNWASELVRAQVEIKDLFN